MKLLRSIGIPCIKVKGYALGISSEGKWTSSNINTSESNHTWNEAYIDNRWIIIDATWSSNNRYENGQYIKNKPDSKYFDMSDELLAKSHLIITRESSIKENDVLNEDGFEYCVENNGSTIVNWTNKGKKYGNLVIPNNLGGHPVLKIADEAFKNMLVDSLTLPDTLKTIGYKAFYASRCKGKIVIPASITKIGSYAFSYIYGVTAFEVDHKNTSYCSVDGVLYNKEVKVLYNYPLGSTRRFYIVPDTVTRLACTCFGNATNLKDLVIKNPIAGCATYTFYGCDMTIYANFGSKMHDLVSKGRISGELLYDNINNFEAKSFANFTKSRTYRNRTFTDICYDKWYYGSVKSAYEQGMMQGSNNLFRPEDSVSVAEAITLAVNVHSIYNKGIQDIESSDIWYRPYVDYAKENAIITKSYSDYNASATRGQVAEIFVNSLPDKALATINNIEDNEIPDVKNTDYYGDVVYKLYRSGIICGGLNGAFRTDDTVLRSEVAAIVNRLINPDERIKVSIP